MLALGLLASCKSSGPSREQKLEIYSGTAFRYYYLGEFERAQDQADRGLAIDPDNYELRLLKARVLQHRNTVATVTEATQLFRDLRKERKDDDRVLIGLGESLEREGVAYDQIADEIEAGERLTSAADPAARVTELRGRARDRWLSALGAFEEAYEVKQRTPQVNGLLRVNSQLGRFEESLTWSNIMIEMLDEQLLAWRRQLDRIELTAEEETRWRENPADDEELKVEVLLFMSTTLARLERHEEAIAALDALLEINPEFPQAYSRRAYHQFELELYQRAIDSLDRFIKLTIERPFEDPEVQQAYNLRQEAEALLAAGSGSSSG